MYHRISSHIRSIGCLGPKSLFATNMKTPIYPTVFVVHEYISYQDFIVLFYFITFSQKYIFCQKRQNKKKCDKTKVERIIIFGLCELKSSKIKTKIIKVILAIKFNEKREKVE